MISLCLDMVVQEIEKKQISKFKASLGYIVRLCLEKTKSKTNALNPDYHMVFCA